jgi:hypothetical protein
MTLALLGGADSVAMQRQKISRMLTFWRSPASVEHRIINDLE